MTVTEDPNLELDDIQAGALYERPSPYVGTYLLLRIDDRADGRELARYDLTEDASTETAMVFGELYRHGGEWKFRAIGQGYASGLAGIARDYGVNVG